MNKSVLNTLKNNVIISGLIAIVVCFAINIDRQKIFHQNSLANHQVSNHISAFQFSKNAFESQPILMKHYTIHLGKKFIPKIELTSDQASVYRNINQRNVELLQTILTNATQREKFKYVMEKAEELKLPAELALIPVIESEYKNTAVSNKGAGGLWQLMPGTAKIFGLSKKKRFDMEASTQAALLHLRDLYSEFGNWELAIAAYNAGDGKVSKALKKNAHAKTVQDLKLPRETRNYVLSFFQLQKALKSYDLT